MFVDQATITVCGGKGGNGVASFRREKHVPRGGPDGGDGGNGGDVVLVVDPSRRTLLDFHYRRQYRAERGMHGSGKNCTGRRGEERVIPVPPGSLVRDVDDEGICWDLVEAGQRVVVARGGRGGRGNARFATPTRRAPDFCEEGKPGEAREVAITLKLLSDIGIIGLPNAGKSTLLSRISAATPRIADYPFTTLTPNLGLVRVDDNSSFTVADIPGIIEGAHQGKGLGLRFLRHVERTEILLYLLDGTSDSLWNDYCMLTEELGSYGKGLDDKRATVAINKLDAMDDAMIDRVRSMGFPQPLFLISALTGIDLKKLVYHLWKCIGVERENT